MADNAAIRRILSSMMYGRLDDLPYAADAIMALLEGADVTYFTDMGWDVPDAPECRDDLVATGCARHDRDDCGGDGLAQASVAELTFHGVPGAFLAVEGDVVRLAAPGDEDGSSYGPAELDEEFPDDGA